MRARRIARTLVVWGIVRGVVLAGLDVLWIHDWRTAAAAWFTFTMVHIATMTEPD